MKIQFIRPAPYNYKQEARSLYDSYDIVARGKANPSVDITRVQLLNLDKSLKVLASPLERSILTAKAINNNYLVLNDLHEISYSMKQIISPERFESFGENGTNIARINFFKALFESKLDESLSDVNARATRLYNNLIDLNSDAVVVSHGFFMKYFEIYCTDKLATLNYKEFVKHYDGSHAPYKFLDGFTVEINDKMERI